MFIIHKLASSFGICQMWQQKGGRENSKQKIEPQKDCDLKG